MTLEHTADFMQMLDDGVNTTTHQVADPERCKTKTGNGEDQADHRETFVPSGIRELEVMLVGARAVENFSDETENIDGGDHDRRAGNDGHYRVERAGVSNDRRKSSFRQ